MELSAECRGARAKQGERCVIDDVVPRDKSASPPVQKKTMMRVGLHVFHVYIFFFLIQMRSLACFSLTEHTNIPPVGIDSLSDEGDLYAINISVLL